MSLKPSTAKSRLSRYLRFVTELAVPPQDSRIIRIPILFNFAILFLEAYHFQNSEGCVRFKRIHPYLGKRGMIPVPLMALITACLIWF